MKNYLSLITCFLVASLFVTCSDDEPQTIFVEVEKEVIKEVTVEVEVPVTATPDTNTIGSDGGITKITEDQTWSNNQIHVIRGKVVIMPGATLTVNAGTIIKAGEGQDNDATALVVARGATINMNGTVASPIIMTDINDNISYDAPSSNRNALDRGKWGGLIVLGKARISDAVEEKLIEGILAVDGENWNFYGGTDNTDNSGTIQYVSIRHSGTQVAPDVELQGLTLGGVGNGTTIENIEIVGSKDDGVELFGGAVNVTNLLIWNQFDDGIDIDMAYSGTVNNAIVEYAADSDGAFEIDGSKDISYEAQNTITGLTVYGRFTEEASDSDQLGRVRENIQIKMMDVHYKGTAAEASKFEKFGDNNGNYRNITSPRTFGTDPNGSEDIIFSDFYFNGAFEQATLVGPNTENTNSARDINTSFADWAAIGTTPDADQGADESVFTWTWWAQEN
ncbi:MAG: hypothetical protein ACON47_07980 [Flavobacteriaceae bacterium]